MSAQYRSGNGNSDRSRRIAIVDADDDDLAIALGEIILNNSDPAGVIVMVDGNSRDNVPRVETAGACRVIGRSAPVGAMLDAIRELEIGGESGQPAVRQEEPAIHPDTSVTELSARETEILSCLANGDTNKLIARQLNIAEATVKVHVKTILRKLHLLNRTQAAIWALHHGVDCDSGNRDPGQ
ncbi:MAG TPA: response regulator transcription factor [Sphingobium sp.]|uniref:response regulator transcription factor n=1 Tax=Sphingobium sp. TaxID=1912891 RepID=UPI002ED29D31